MKEVMKKILISIIAVLVSHVAVLAQEITVATDNTLLVADSIMQPSDTLVVDSLPPLPWEQRLQVQLDSLLANDDLLQTTQLGLMVWDLTADSAVYAYNHMHRMRPASTMKLLTSITALDCLGPSHVFSTELRSRGQLVGHTLVGDLTCVGGMDPSFDSGDMRVLVDRVRQAGIDTICGRIVADKSMKDTLVWGEGWCWDDDNPCLSALLVGRKDNFAERLTRELLSAGIVLTDSVPDSLAVAASGRSSRPMTIATISHPLTQIMKHMNKQSDNLYAESVFYHIGLSAGRPSTVKNARNGVKSLIQKLGYMPANYYIADGSGLSLYTYISPELLVSFLRYAYQNAAIYERLLPTLPIAGVDGTLNDRMRSTPAYRNVKAKTGTVSGVSSLAGYCTASNGHQLAFSIINQGVSKSKYGKNFQDKVCSLLCK